MESNDEPLSIEDSENEGADNGVPRSVHASAFDPSAGAHATTRSVLSSSSTVSHQAMLRQQALVSPVSYTMNSTNTPSNFSFSNPNAYSHPRLEDLNLSSSETTPQQQRPSFSIPEHGVLDSPSSSSHSSSSGWSIVEMNGGTPPSPRSLHAAALLNGVMYVFGGYDGMSRVNTFHAFSFAEKRWSPVLPSASSAHTPSPRDRHVAFSFGNSFYVHGGFDGTSRVSDFWGFDFSSMTWREVVVLAGRPPSPRHSHAAVAHLHSLYIFGGYDGSYK
jgi:hypothetical protein